MFLVFSPVFMLIALYDHIVLGNPTACYLPCSSGSSFRDFQASAVPSCVLFVCNEHTAACERCRLRVRLCRGLPRSVTFCARGNKAVQVRLSSGLYYLQIGSRHIYIVYSFDYEILCTASNSRFCHWRHACQTFFPGASRFQTCARYDTHAQHGKGASNVQQEAASLTVPNCCTAFSIVWLLQLRRAIPRLQKITL